MMHVTRRPDPLILLTVYDDWRRYRLSCIAHGTWADYHLIDNELNQFPVWTNQGLPSALGIRQPPTQMFLRVRHAGTRDKPLRTSAWEATLGTDHLFLVEGLGQFLLSMNFFLKHHYLQEFFSRIKLDKSLQEFFSPFNVILSYQEKKTLVSTVV